MLITTTETIMPAEYFDDHFTPAQCEGGIIMGLLGNKKAEALSDRYLADAMEQMSDDDFVAMMQRIAIKTS